MLTIQEFATAADRHWRRCLRVLFALSVVLLAVAFWLSQLGSSWLVVVGLMAVPVVLMLLAAVPLNMAAHRDPRLVCPHCEKGLFRSRFRVFAIRACPRCRRELFDDSDPPEPPSLTRDELEDLAARYRRFLRAGFLWLPLTLLITAAIGLGSEALVDAGWMRKPVSEGIAVVLLVVLFAVAIRGAIFSLRSWSTLVACRRCGWIHSPRRLMKTGQCDKCHRTMVVVPSGDGMAAGPPPV